MDPPSPDSRLRLSVGLFYLLSSSRTRQLTLDDAMDIWRNDRDEGLASILAEMGERYGMDLSPESDSIYRMESLHSLVERMRVRRMYG